MKSTLIILAAIALVAGCNSNKKKQDTSPMPAANAGALNTSVASASPTAPAAQYTPPPAPQPIMHDVSPLDQPVIGEEATADISEEIAAPAPQRQVARRTTAARSAAPARATRYKVKKGESLWSIAETRYGNGNKWKAIAAANPTLDPDHVMAGQTIVLP